MITLQKIIGQPSAEVIAQRELEESRRQLLQAHTQIELGTVHVQRWKTAVEVLEARINWLSDFVKGGAA